MKTLSSIVIILLLWAHIAPQVSEYIYWHKRVGNICHENIGGNGTRGVFYHWSWTKLELRTLPTCFYQELN